MNALDFDTVLTALLDLYTAAAPDGAKVIDGEPKETRGTFVCVGWGGGEGEVSGTGTFEQAGMRYNHDIEVPCLLGVWGGKQGVKLREVRRSALTLWNTLNAALAADRKVGGAMKAVASRYAYLPNVTPSGILVGLSWVVTAQGQQAP